MVNDLALLYESELPAFPEYKPTLPEPEVILFARHFKLPILSQELPEWEQELVYLQNKFPESVQHMVGGRGGGAGKKSVEVIVVRIGSVQR